MVDTPGTALVPSAAPPPPALSLSVPTLLLSLGSLSAVVSLPSVTSIFGYSVSFGFQLLLFLTFPKKSVATNASFQLGLTELGA